LFRAPQSLFQHLYSIKKKREGGRGEEEGEKEGDEEEVWDKEEEDNKMNEEKDEEAMGEKEVSVGGRWGESGGGMDPSGLFVTVCAWVSVCV